MKRILLTIIALIFLSGIGNAQTVKNLHAFDVSASGTHKAVLLWDAPPETGIKRYTVWVKQIDSLYTRYSDITALSDTVEVDATGVYFFKIQATVTSYVAGRATTKTTPFDTCPEVAVNIGSEKWSGYDIPVSADGYLKNLGGTLSWEAGIAASNTDSLGGLPATDYLKSDSPDSSKDGSLTFYRDTPGVPFVVSDAAAVTVPNLSAEMWNGHAMPADSTDGYLKNAGGTFTWEAGASTSNSDSLGGLPASDYLKSAAADTSFDGSMKFYSATPGQIPFYVLGAAAAKVPNLDSDKVDGMNPDSTNTANTIVSRGASGNFAAGTITATLAGTATNATNAAVDTSSANSVFFPTFSPGLRGNHALKTFSGLQYNPYADELTAGKFIGNLTGAVTGNASTATKAYATDKALTAGTGITSTGTFDGSTARTFNIDFGTTSGTVLSGTHAGTIGTGAHGEVTTSTAGFMKATDKVILDAATNANTANAIVKRDAYGNFSANVITANLTGTVTGNVTGSSGSTTGNAATATVATAVANALTPGSGLTAGGPYTFNGDAARTFALDWAGSGGDYGTQNYPARANHAHSLAYAALAHNHSWSNLTSGVPTTASGYGITDIPTDGDFSSNGFMLRTGAGTYSVQAAGYTGTRDVIILAFKGPVDGHLHFSKVTDTYENGLLKSSSASTDIDTGITYP